MSVAVTETYALDECYLCACGCGDEVNPKVRQVDELLARGMSKRQVALRLQVSPHYVRILTREATPDRQGRPRFIKGHSARLNVYTDATCRNCGRFYRKCGAQQLWCRSDKCQIARWIATSSFELLSKIEGRSSDDLRDEIATSVFIGSAQRHYEDVQRKADSARAVVQRKADSAEKEAERSLFWKMRSLDAPIHGDGIRKREGTELPSLAETIHRHEDNTAIAFEQEERSNTLRRIVGELTSEDVARMDASELDAIRRKLVEEGITPGTIQARERERLREPNRHAGAFVPKMGRRSGGKRTRAQQQQVTRDHHVRELPTKAKREHAALRRVRKERVNGAETPPGSERTE